MGKERLKNLRSRRENLHKLGQIGRDCSEVGQLLCLSCLAAQQSLLLLLLLQGSFSANAIDLPVVLSEDPLLGLGEVWSGRGGDGNAGAGCARGSSRQWRRRGQHQHRPRQSPAGARGGEWRMSVREDAPAVRSNSQFLESILGNWAKVVSPVLQDLVTSLHVYCL